MNKSYFKYKLRTYAPNLPPPPPPPKKSHKMLIVAVVVLIAVLLIPAVLYYSGTLAFMLNPNNPNVTPNPFTPTPGPTLPPSVVTTNHFTMQTGSKVQATTQSISSSGGKIQVTDSSSPLNGLKIDVPAAATSAPVQFQVSYKPISSMSGLPENNAVASKLISIETSGSSTFNTYKMFDKPIEVTLPYDASEANDDNNPVRFYWYDSATGKLDSTGFLRQDKAAHTITFLTGSFSDFVAIRTMLGTAGQTWGIDVPVDTGFRPTRDGWYIPNYGSYLSDGTTSTVGGMCLGMVSYAKWYYSNIGTGMQAKYIQGSPTEWRDDATAIQLAARAHLATSGIWNSLTQEERDWATANAREVALSWIAGMLVTGEPQLIGLKAQTNNGTWLNYAHAVMTYAYNDGKFEIYDPNFPNSQPGNAMREIPFTYSTGFSETYISGKTRADNLVFNIFYHAGSKLSSTPEDYRGLYDSAQTGFTGNSQFPTIKLTDSTTSPEGTTPVDTDSDDIRDTTEAKVTISGTITGGNAPLNSTLLFVSNQKFTVPVVDGAFSAEVPLMAGNNDVVVLATDESAFFRWAGFFRDTIRSTASPAAMTITLTWGQDNSDVDLHVQEPGADGGHIYWSNRNSGGNNPYLDMDNTHGYGPEHFYATEDMTLPGATSLYGKYQIRVQYYSDKDDNSEETQAITWHLNVQYLAFKNAATGQEFWVEQSRSGTLTTTSSSGTDNFFNSGPSWTDIWEIDYVAPDPADYGIPPPPQNVFPS
jgi:uncharacterized protein YfaP (DUF2135 family)